MIECDMCGDYTGGEPRHAICALAMALHKTRWSNDADEFDLALARERAAEIIQDLSESGVTILAPLIGHPYTCAYCRDAGIFGYSWTTRAAFEAHMANMHSGLPFEPGIR